MNSDLKIFLIKLFSITLSIIIIISFVYNTIFAERMTKIDNALSFFDEKNKLMIKEKIRKELIKGIEKENLINFEDKEIIYKIYIKLKKEFQEFEKTK